MKWLGSNPGVSVVKERVGAVNDISDPAHLGHAPVEPASKKSGDRWAIREEGGEEEAPTQGGVEQRDRAIRGVHRADHQQVWWEVELCG